MINTLGEEGDLDIRGAGILRVKAIAGDDLAFGFESHELRIKSYGKKISSQDWKMAGDAMSIGVGKWLGSGGGGSDAAGGAGIGGVEGGFDFGGEGREGVQLEGGFREDGFYGPD